MSVDAFIGVLACARAADGSFPEEERGLVNLICQSHALTRDLAPEAYRNAVQQVKERVDGVGWQEALAGYLQSLPATWAYTVLFSVIDICLIDRNEHQNEARCIEMVAKHFGIPPDHVNNFVHWFRVKNGLEFETGAGAADQSQVA